MFAEEKKEIAAKTEKAVTDISLDPRHFLQVETMALPQVSADFVETLEDTAGKSLIFGYSIVLINFQYLINEEH